MIVHIPDFPELDERGHPPRPLVLLFGRGGWQDRAARNLSKAARGVICGGIPVPPRYELSSGQAFEAWGIYFDAVDIIVTWCGNDEEVLYLDHWTYLGYALGRCPTKIVCGISREPDHPMANGLRFLLQSLRIEVYDDLDYALTVASERCRELRRLDHG